MNREERFIKNEILLAAIYLGPRYKVLLSDDDKICAKKHLVNLWRRIKSLTTPILSDDISSDELEHPELYILSKILFAVPATQVSVERSFSHLKFILSPHRSRMSEQLLEDIMLIRLNKIFKIDT
ncbi:unnamed protein product [Gordionus sp. m RMFG-2023]